MSPLTPPQIRWLGVLLIAAQLPQAVHLPLWVALFGAMLVALRFALLRRDRVRPAAQPARIPSWALALFALAIGLAIRQSFGYFVGRDPCVAFLFVLVGIKFLEARTLRDGTLLVCLAMRSLLITPFFYSQSMLAAVAALPAVLLMGGALDALARPACRGTSSSPRGARAVRRTAGDDRCRDCRSPLLLFVLFPRLTAPLWGLPTRCRRTHRACPTACRQARSASCRCPTRSRFASTSTARYRRRATVTGADPCCRRSTAATWRRSRRDCSMRLPPAMRRVVRYTVSARAQRPSVAVRPRPARSAAAAGHGDRASTRAMCALARLTRRPAAGDARAGDPAVALRADIAAELDAIRPHAAREAEYNRATATRQPAHHRARARPAPASPARRRLHHVRCCDTSATSRSSTRSRRRCSRATPVDEFLFDERRGFCEHFAERVRGADARRRHSGARRHGLPGRRDQSATAAT